MSWRTTLLALEQIGREGVPEVDDPAIEDVHHYVETRLVEIAGEVGYKLHTGRSRNEQIATDLRLYVREQIDEITKLLRVLRALWAAEARVGAPSRQSGEKDGDPSSGTRGDERRCRPPTRTCNAPSRCWWRIGCWRMSRCFCATSIGWTIAASG